MDCSNFRSPIGPNSVAGSCSAPKRREYKTFQNNRPIHAILPPGGLRTPSPFPARLSGHVLVTAIGILCVASDTLETSNSHACNIPAISLVRHFGYAITDRLRARLRESARLYKPLSRRHGRVARGSARLPAFALSGL